MDRITRAKSERVRIASRTHACTHHGQSKATRQTGLLVAELSGWIALVIKLCLELLYRL